MGDFVRERPRVALALLVAVVALVAFGWMLGGVAADSSSSDAALQQAHRSARASAAEVARLQTRNRQLSRSVSQLRAQNRASARRYRASRRLIARLRAARQP